MEIFNQQVDAEVSRSEIATRLELEKFKQGCLELFREVYFGSLPI